MRETAEIAQKLDPDAVESIAKSLAQIRETNGRVFIVGMGGSATNASHAAADFRRLANIEAFAASDNVADFSARLNDEGIDQAFKSWLESSRMGPNDGLMILSVGGGSRDRNVSVGVVVAAEFAREVGATVYAIVGRSNGDAVALAQHSLLIPVSGERLTPHAESFQSVIWHLLVSHPLLSVGSPLWESLEPGQASRLR